MIRKARILLTLMIAITTMVTAVSTVSTASAQGEKTGSVRFHVFLCPEEFQGTTGGDYFNSCSGTGLEGVDLRLTDLSSIDVVNGATSGTFDVSDTTVLEGAPGVVQFDNVPAGLLTTTIDLPGATNNFYFYCGDADNQETVPADPIYMNLSTFSLNTGQNLLCDWFVVPDPNDIYGYDDEAFPQQAQPTETPAEPTQEPTNEPAEPTLEPTNEPVEPTQEATTPPENTTGSITIDMRQCPDGFSVADGTTFSDFQTNCTDGTDGVTLRLTDVDSGNFSEQVTDPQLNNTFPDLPDGSYTLYSNIPAADATEYLFCQADGGNIYQKSFNSNGVTEYSDMVGEEIFCSWYVVPAEGRGDPTGGTLTVHLALCPVEYDGDDLFNDCHSNGIHESPFELTGPAGSTSGVTEVVDGEGPGLLAFEELAAGDYRLRGGPPGDFGRVAVYCSDQATDEAISVTTESTQAYFAIGENQHILCDWYFIPTESGVVEPTPTEEPDQRAEILITMFMCDQREGGYAGWGFSDLDDTCTARVNDVPFRLGAEGGVPLTASTGDSGDGAVRFYDLLPGDFTASPTLPSGYSNVAVFCSIGDSTDVYQKNLQSGATTYVDVNGEEINCSWFITENPVVEGPSGSITVREFICEKDRSEITNWEKDCVAGNSGNAYTLASGGWNTSGTPNANGVVVFTDLSDGLYTLTQNEGTWCRATAERVDSSSRVIVADGGNTDVYLFHCGDVTSLPSTGSGVTNTTPDSGLPGYQLFLALAALLTVPAIGMIWWTRVRHSNQAPAVVQENQNVPQRLENGMYRMRFR